MAENPREITLDILLTLERGEELSHRLIRAVLDKYDYLEGRDKAFIKRLSEGSIERGLELDYLIGAFSSVPVHKMKPLIRCLLRMSAYQILYMDNVPDSAACNEAVKLAKKRGFARLSGFVNGVLRSISRQKEVLPYPDGSNEVETLSVRYSMPEWIVQMWLAAYGRERTGRILAGLLAIHPVSLRFRMDLADEALAAAVAAIEATGAVLTRSPLLPTIYLAEHVDNVSSLPGFLEGLFTVQDASSALAVEAAGIRTGDTVLDICAAPGGKSMIAAELVGPSGYVCSRDVSEEKVARIDENVLRLHAGNVHSEVWDATVRDPAWEEKADVVLADVPCSGLGILGKKRDIKYHVSPASLASLEELQKQILTASLGYVKKGGVLLYSTCTIHRAENEDMVRWITENHPFTLDKERQLLPGEDATDGFYYARLRRL